MSIFNCVPAMMYHHVNHEPETSVSITPENFEAQIKYLAEAGYRSLHLSEFYKCLNDWDIPEKLILITFDDGYTDNYLYAFPILKKYNMKATIFPVTAFIKDRAPKDRKLPDNQKILLDSIYAKGGLDGYLTWEEMKEMASCGLIDIQAHCHTHAAYFESDKVISFYNGDFNPKIGWATDGDLRLGIPVYRTGPAICVRRYFDDKALRDKLADHVANNGGKAFLLRPEANDILFDIVEKHGKLNGKFEPPLESESRIMNELHFTKELIEIKLNRKVDYICWPWGSVDNALINRARRAGYVGGIGMKEGANMRLTNVMDIHRFNASPKSIPQLKQKLFKHSRLFYSIYNDKRIDNLLMPISRFK